MATVIRLDSHVVVWLYAGQVERLSSRARALLEDHDAVISPIVELELTFLHEIERITASADQITADLRERIGLARSPVPFQSVVAAASLLRWTRDPFDRLIVGDSLAAGATLITKDSTIRAEVPSALW